MRIERSFEICIWYDHEYDGAGIRSQVSRFFRGTGYWCALVIGCISELVLREINRQLWCQIVKKNTKVDDIAITQFLNVLNRNFHKP